MNSCWVVNFRNPEVQYRIHNGTPIIAILSRINHIPRIYIYFFNVLILILSYLLLSLRKGVSPLGLPFTILKTLLPSLSSKLL